ncbi:MAG: hypothetical protein Q9228_007932 [Teloschistes exilis]
MARAAADLTASDHQSALISPIVSRQQVGEHSEAGPSRPSRTRRTRPKQASELNNTSIRSVHKRIPRKRNTSPASNPNPALISPQELPIPKPALHSLSSEESGKDESGVNDTKREELSDTDDDEPVFLGGKIARRLAEKYSYVSSSSDSSNDMASKPLAVAKREKKESKSKPPPLPLLPSLPARPPLPVPPWLGKASILNQLSTCVVCKVPFKKTDSGAARWVSKTEESIQADQSSGTSPLVFLRSIDPQTLLQISQLLLEKHWKRSEVQVLPLRLWIIIFYPVPTRLIIGYTQRQRNKQVKGRSEKPKRRSQRA